MSAQLPDFTTIAAPTPSAGDADRWRSGVESATGLELSKLAWETPEGIDVAPLYTAADVSISKASGDVNYFTVQSANTFVEDTTRFGNLQLARVFTSAGWSVSEASIRRWRSANNVTE